MRRGDSLGPKLPYYYMYIPYGYFACTAVLFSPTGYYTCMNNHMLVPACALNEYDYR